MSSRIRKYKQLRWLSLAIVGLALLAVWGCNSDSADNSNDASCPGCGEVYISLTDADGDFTRYQVDVVSLTLKRRDGTEVETLPMATTVDLAEYTDLSEFLTVATVPPGVYVEGSITLDYTNAEIFVERDGSPAEAVVLDENGSPADVQTLNVRLDNSRRLIVVPGVPAMFHVDVDLNASHEIDLTPTPIEATVRPFIVADISPDLNKQMRLRGPLVGVQLADSTYTIAIRPFHLHRGHFGRLKIKITDSTVFDIDGNNYVGDAGLQALAAKPAGTATVAWGSVDIRRRLLVADQVHAGTTVPGGDMDAAKGAIIARNGNELTLHGAALVRLDSSLYIDDNMIITVGPNTKVRKWADAGEFTIDDISVGQRVVVLGTVDNANPAQMDATEGLVRLLPTPAHGTVVATATGQVDLDLQSLAWRSPAKFDFTGTGATLADDADPDNYEVDLNGLSGSGILAGDPVRIMGTVSPFGQAPADFTAQSIVDYTDAHAKLGVNWNPAANNPFVSLSATGIVIDREHSDIGDLHHLRRGGILTDLAALPDSPTIQPHNTFGLYCILERGMVRVFSNFELFTTALSDALSNGGTVAVFHAYGGYDSSANIFSARRIAVRMGN